MDTRLLEAATTGDTTAMHDLASCEPGVLVGTTPRGNNCLHIAAIHGHQGFCEAVLTHDQHRLPLLQAINADGETPLLTAVARGRADLASILLGFSRGDPTVLKQDRHGLNALHHAICSGQRKLALELIEAEPALSRVVNNSNESPMYAAVMRNYGEVLEKLLEIIPDVAVGGARGYNALHAAVTTGNAVLAKRVMEKCPGLARQENEDKRTPMILAAKENKISVLTVLLEHDPSMGYLISTDGSPLLCVAATEGNVGVARELLRHCPDPPYYNASGLTCLHIAVSSGQADFVRFVVRSPQLQHLVNVPNDRGETALQLAQKILQQDGKEESKKKMKSLVDVLHNVPNDRGETALQLAPKILQQDGKEESKKKMKSVVDVLQFYLTNPSINTERFTSGMEQLMEAAVKGYTTVMSSLAPGDPCVLLGTTPQGNTCLHIAAIHGQQVFCEKVLALNPSLLATVNSDGETPLLAAVTSGHVSVASVLLRCCHDQQLSETILKQDKRGCNALHHAIRSGQRKLALELIEAEPALSQGVNENGESPMFIAVMRKYEDVFDKLLGISDFAHGGACGMNALHAAVRTGNSAIAKKIIQKRPMLATEEDIRGYTPMMLTVLWDKINVLRVLLEQDPSLGYVVSSRGVPLLNCAACRGRVDIARELLKHCPDACYSLENGLTCLHQAAVDQQMEFLQFVLSSPQLKKLVNMQDKDGDTALDIAVSKCNPKMVAALLLHRDIDSTMFNNKGVSVSWALPTNRAKTLNWNEVSMLLLKANPEDAPSIFNLHKQVKDKVTNLSRKDIKSLTQIYTGNTSLVAILIATITFTAAFTLPGGYSTDPGNEGHPILARKLAFKAFLISDTLAMCSSLAVAFVCIIAKWEDLEFLLYYRSFTRMLMWFAYVATSTAFATGLYTILAPHLMWLGIMVCVLTPLLPILTKLLGEWHIQRLRFRLRQNFRSDLLDMV